MANYPQNTHYMQQQQQQQQHQQQMNHQRQQHAQALYMQQQHAIHHQMSSDGSIRQAVPQHMMMPPPGQRPQGRMMYMTAAPTSQAQQQHMQMQQQQQQQQQQQTQRAMAMNQQRQQQQMMPNSQQQPQQHYYNIQPPPQRGMVPSPMKVPPQQLQIKSEGMRTPIHMAPQQMIIRGPAPGGYESVPSQVIIQQQQPQQQQQQQQIATSSSSQAYISRVPISQAQQIRQPQAHSQLVRTSTGIVQRIVRPGDVEMHGSQYVIRQSAPQGFAYVPSSSGEPQYHIVQQGPSFVQAQGPGQTTVRTVRHIQVSQPQTPLRMALTQPNSQGNMVIPSGVVVIQSSSGNEGVTPMIVDQSTGNVIATSSNTPQQVTIATTTPIQIKQTPQIVQRPPITTVVPPAATVAPKTTPSKSSSKKPTKKPASKPGPSTTTPAPAPVAPVKPAEPPATVLTPQTKLVQHGHLDSIIGTTRANDSYETSVKNAVNEFAEIYAEFLLDELVDAARLRKVTKIENRDAKFVILRESNKEKDSDGKKK